jgi:hypothetical protein
MTTLFMKLNLPMQSKAITVLQSPPSFEPELTALAGISVRRDGRSSTTFLLAFATRLADVAAAAKVAATKTSGDAVVWIAYPKGTSKILKCEFNRDTGFQALGDQGFEPVRMVAIDDNWSALRFRRVEFIKTMTRDPKRRISR